MCVFGLWLDGCQFVPPCGPGVNATGVFQYGVNISFARTTLVGWTPCAVFAFRCAACTCLTSWAYCASDSVCGTNGAYEGNGCVGHVFCRGSCGPGCSGIGKSGLPFVRSRR